MTCQLRIGCEKKTFSIRGTSYFWNGFIRTLTWITISLRWKVGNGQSIKLGIDPIIGLDSFQILSKDLRDYLCDYGLHTPQDARNVGFGLNRQSYWIMSENLELGGIWKYEWDCYIKNLMQGGLRLIELLDKVLSMHSKKMER